MEIDYASDSAFLPAWVAMMARHRWLDAGTSSACTHAKFWFTVDNCFKTS